MAAREGGRSLATIPAQEATIAMQQDSAIQPGASQWIGKPLRRLEDQKLLTGQGRFTDDVELPGQAHAAFAR